MKAGDEKLIADWQNRLRESYGDATRLYQYLFETMDNFCYRYLETTTDKDLKTSELADHVWGAQSSESDMMSALKVQNRATKELIMELAKSVPKAEGPVVHYSLRAQVKDLVADHGHLVLVAEVKALQTVKKEVVFKYDDLAQFRKGLALKLEEVCEIFL